MPGTNHESCENHVGLTVPFQASGESLGASISSQSVPRPEPMTLEINLEPARPDQG